MSGQSGEKTEQPTSKRLSDARKKGQVAFSKDVSSAAVLIALFTYIGMSFDYTMAELRQLVDFIGRLYTIPFQEAVNSALQATTVCMLKLFVPPMMIAALTGVAAGYFQVGALLTFEPMKPDLKKLNPVDGAKKIVGKKNLIEFGKNIVKLLFIGYLIYKVVIAAIPDLITITFGGMDAIMPAINQMMKRTCVYACMGFIIIACIDVLLQKKAHTKELMMTKDEVKREYKESEGSPEIKGQRKQLHRELVTGNAPANVKKSSVVVTNPTHYAVGLFYEKDNTPLPIITAKGAGELALLIRKTAEENNIPIMENVPLAQALFRQGQIENYIPRDLLQPVAEILHWADQIKAGKA